MLWKPIPGWEAAYQVSDTGLVASVARTVIVRDPQGRLRPRRFSARLLAPATAKNGYHMVSLTSPGRTRKYAYVHDLVLAAFRGPKPAGKESCHRNGKRTDNRLRNLRYGTRSENAIDRKKHGVPWLKGEDCGSAKLAEKNVRWIRANIGRLSARSMANKLGVTHKTVCAVISGESWGHVK